MKDSKETNERLQERPGSGLKRLAVVLIFALIAFVAYDWFLNQRHMYQLVVHWNALQLHTQGGTAWTLKAKKDFALIELTDTSHGMTEATLHDFDKPFREQGLYRVYFRRSDARSDKFQKILKEISLIDTAKSIEKTIEQVKKSYEGARKLFRRDSAASRDTVAILLSDSSGKPVRTDLVSGSEEEVYNQLTTLVKKNPQILIGLGVGIAASAGIDLLEGEMYLATSTNDVFRVDSLRIGPRAGFWEGKNVDILWAFRKPLPGETTQARH